MSKMERSDYLRKLYFKQWTIGIAVGNVEEIIRKRNFDLDIKWLTPQSKESFQADPFPIMDQNGVTSILYEDFSIEENYGNISVMTLDSLHNPKDCKILLDTRSHLSFPFVFIENNRYFVIPESVKSNTLSCYEYDPEKRTLSFRGEIMKMPLYDPVVFKRNGKYWLFGAEFRNREDYRLYVFHSQELMGPYTPVSGNPVRTGIDGVRAAGGFIEVDGEIFRPTQNCKNEYGESITINKIKRLDENGFEEEPYMTIVPREKDIRENNIHTIHTFNISGNLIIVDGNKWTFSLVSQWKNFLRNRRLLSLSKI
jgi:hypothetical protein